ncbi:hypothetical protein EJB05_47565 [Eragrostis curvula]|uniref:Uncharacterized protein n=1 Tax=Eragrostis curvula TaxID=38414 RepID=A0A5J9SZK8_9POAL|nr:hypothetical protein EJB05_47565 [Eragrostis curvula]
MLGHWGVVDQVAVLAPVLHCQTEENDATNHGQRQASIKIKFRNSQVSDASRKTLGAVEPHACQIVIPRLALHMSIFECSSRPEPKPHASAPTGTSSLHCHGGSKRSGTAGGDDSGQGQAPTTIHREQQEDGSEAGPAHFLSLRIHLESSIKASKYSS